MNLCFLDYNYARIVRHSSAINMHAQAMARTEKAGVRIDGTKARRLSKLSLKHMY